MRTGLLRCSLAICAFAAAGQSAAQSQWKAFSGRDGQAPAALILQDLQGKSLDLKQFHGEVVLVNFWATWCEPCRDEIPSLNRLQKQFDGKPLRILGVNIGEGKARIEQFMQRVPIEFTVLRDPDSEVMKAWRVKMLPVSFLIDKKGQLRYQLVGEANWDEAGIRAPVSELLK